MKAWEIRNNRLNLRDVTPPRTSYAETVLRMSHTGICGSDIPKLRSPTSFSLPHSWRPGHEIVGMDPTGRVVAVDPLVPCHLCPRCTEGDTHLCPKLQRLGWDLPGGFAEEVLAPTGNIHPLPTRVDRLRAVLADPTAVAIHGLRCTPVIPPGRLAVIGTGTVGLLTALYAHQQGWEVTVIHRDDRPPTPVVVEAIPGEFRPPSSGLENAFSVVVDAASGAESTPLVLALRLIQDGGTIVVQNAYHPNVALPVPLRDLFRRSIRLLGSFSHCRRSGSDFHLGLSLLDQHAESVSPLIAEAGPLTELSTLLDKQDARVGRWALTAQ